MMLTSTSQHDHGETMRRLLDACNQRGLTVFARIDHAAGAREVGLELGEEQVLIFGSPKAGTGLMQSDPKVGIELPLRILVWAQTDAVHIGYNDPRELADGYALRSQRATLDAMSELLAGLVAEAAGASAGAPESAPA